MATAIPVHPVNTPNQASRKATSQLHVSAALDMTSGTDDPKLVVNKSEATEATTNGMSDVSSEVSSGNDVDKCVPSGELRGERR
jgi:hypothetical protein